MKQNLNIIHDSRRTERLDSILQEVHSQNCFLDFRIWSCVVHPDSVVDSIADSHKTIVQYALEMRMEEVLIAEDDFGFTSPNSFRYFYSKKPKEYKLYTACNYLHRINPTNDLVGLHFYLIHHSYYEEFLSIPKGNHIDQAVKTEIHVCYPYPVLQKPFWSANNKAVVDYNTMLKPEDIYR